MSRSNSSTSRRCTPDAKGADRPAIIDASDRVVLVDEQTVGSAGPVMPFWVPSQASQGMVFFRFGGATKSSSHKTQNREPKFDRD